MPAALHLDPDLLAEFWRRVDIAASVRGVTWRRLADRLGVDETTISRMRSGERNTPLDTAVHIARRLSAPEVLADALTLVTDVPVRLLPSPVEAGSRVLDEAGGFVSAWARMAADGIDEEERVALLPRLHKLRAAIDEAIAALEVPASKVVTRG